MTTPDPEEFLYSRLIIMTNLALSEIGTHLVEQIDRGHTIAPFGYAFSQTGRCGRDQLVRPGERTGYPCEDSPVHVASFGTTCIGARQA